MHPLNNGSQVENVPALKPRVGTAGYFSESNDNGAPSYPGQDWFNAVIREFQTALSASGVAFDPDKFDHLQKLLEANGNQFAPYRSDRVYKTGEVCYTITNDELSFWQWYSNVEFLSGKDPLNLNNRHENWSDNTKPFYWIPYTGDQVGMPFFWVDTSPPEWAVMEINVDLPIAVYWRLARRYPHLVNGTNINTGEIRGEFLRVLDQGRGVDVGRVLGSYQSDDFEAHHHLLTAVYGGGATSPTFSSAYASPFFAGNTANQNDGSFANAGTQTHGAAEQGAYKSPDQQKLDGNGIETRPRNAARSMAITI